MQRSEQRILTTHAGSLPRPQPLTELYAARVDGESVDEAQLAHQAQRAVAEIVPKQIDAGIDIINNGEQSREAFFLYVQRRMSGFGGRGERQPWRDVVNYPDFLAARNRENAGKAAVSNMAPPKVVGEIRYLDRALVEQECEQFEAVLGAHPQRFVESFVTAPSPGIIAAAIPNEHYDTFDNYLAALTNALKVEYQTIVERGHLLQLDCPDLAMERHISFADRPLHEFIDFVEQVIDAINKALTGIARDRVRLHVCWGNYEGPHDLDVPLADILTPILGARVGAFLFSMANPRHAHEHVCFRNNVLDDDQILLAGVIDTTTNFVEHPEVVAQRIELAARAVGDPTRVIAATDCGFDTSAGMGRVAESIVWAKLRALSDGAAIASKRLFS
ncbi:MAG: 5-methyltetrahydropteroyltriglutamate--homocysteine methyltransferase [Gammaproteobacteria bacterium]|jgi:5-methyltetrahydropteroyltriglutamate--homocysteine methyltransferase